MASLARLLFSCDETDSREQISPKHLARSLDSALKYVLSDEVSSRLTQDQVEDVILWLVSLYTEATVGGQLMRTGQQTMRLLDELEGMIAQADPEPQGG